MHASYFLKPAARTKLIDAVTSLIPDSKRVHALLEDQNERKTLNYVCNNETVLACAISRYTTNKMYKAEYKEIIQALVTCVANEKQLEVLTHRSVAVALSESFLNADDPIYKLISVYKLKMEAELQEAEKQEAEKQEAEKQEAEKQEAEKQEAEKQEAERRGAERKQAEQKEEKPIDITSLTLVQQAQKNYLPALLAIDEELESRSHFLSDKRNICSRIYLALKINLLISQLNLYSNGYGGIERCILQKNREFLEECRDGEAGKGVYIRRWGSDPNECKQFATWALSLSERVELDDVDVSLIKQAAANPQAEIIKKRLLLGMKNAGMEKAWINQKEAVALPPAAASVAALAARASQQAQAAQAQAKSREFRGAVVGFAIPQY